MTRKWEVRGLLLGMDELDLREGLIVTEDYEDDEVFAFVLQGFCVFY